MIRSVVFGIFVSVLGCAATPKATPPTPVEYTEPVMDPGSEVSEPGGLKVTPKDKRLEIFWPDVATGVLKYQSAMSDFWLKYDRNFEVLFEPYQKLYEQMGWARVENTSEITSLSTGELVAFFAMYDLTNPNLEKKFSTFSVTQPGPHVVVMIRPEQISSAWIPAFLIHEMSHVAVKLNKKPIDITLDEAAAYSLEKLTLNMITKNALDRELDFVLKDFGIKNEMNLLDLPKRKLFSRLAKSDAKMFEKPLSYAEGEMRMGFYWIALGFRWVEKQSITPKAQKDRQYKFLKKFLAKNSNSI